MPIVMSANKDKTRVYENFPLNHYSQSSFSKFSSNAFMFKVNNINGDTIETTRSASSVLGSACHKALQTYFGGNPEIATSANEGEAIKEGHAVGLAYIESQYDGFIEYNTVIENRAELNEKYAFAYFGYLKEMNTKDIKELLIVERKLEHKVEVDGKILPVPLQGYPDVVYRNAKGEIIIVDHKFTSRYSKEEDIDAAKLIQAAFMYFLVYAELGERPHSIIFNEFKHVENRDKSPQNRAFEIVFEEDVLIFDFFFRLYGDITDALLGKQVYVPNFYATYDKEVSIMAYIHRLDVDEERAKAFAAAKVDNITDFLKKKIMKTGAMKKYLDIVSTKFISANTLNYKDMKLEDKIKMKMAEHGLGVEFDSKIEGPSVTLYRFEPSVGLKMSKIEAYVKDIEQVVEVSGIRVLAPIPNSGLIGFEVPNAVRHFPKGIPSSELFNLAIGEDILGQVRRFDIREAPHMLVAGSTGSGKSVFLNSIIDQLLQIPNADLCLYDPKQVELFHYEGKKGVAEYLSNHREIVVALHALVSEMEMRYTAMKEAGVRNISQMKNMPYKFIIIDEFADLSSHGNVENRIQLLAQKGRACGIHLIIATQRASTKVINGDIKINFPTRVVFKMAKGIDSRVMIDVDGAEKLLGKGDMLFVGDQGVERLQGYMS